MTCLNQNVLVSGRDKIQTQVGLALTCSEAAFPQGGEGGGKEEWHAGKCGCRGVEEEGLAVFLTKGFGVF